MPLHQPPCTIMKTFQRAAVAAALLSLGTHAFAEGDSPWLPIPGQLSLGIGHTQQSGKNAYIGATKVPIVAVTGGGATAYKRSTTQVRLGYGLSDALALDATVGYGQTRVGAADAANGTTDSVLGVQWRVLDEFERIGLPSVALRGAAILKGSGDGARLGAISNAENGVELSLQVGKQITPGIAVWADLGVQKRSGDIPTATFASINTRFRFAEAWSVTAAYAQKNYGGDLDIGGPGFSPARFQEVRAERGLAKLSVAYSLLGNQSLSLNLASVVRGRNTVKDDAIVGAAYSYGF
jgi:hypothetical protein